MVKKAIDISQLTQRLKWLELKTINLFANIDHKEIHTLWLFEYFGYSKIWSKAYHNVKWTSDENSLSFDKAE